MRSFAARQCSNRVITAFHPLKRLLHLPLPVGKGDNGPLERADQVKGNALPNPQALEPPAVKGEVYAERQRTAVVADNVDGRANVLPALASERAAAATVEPVGDLEERNVRHNMRRQLDDADVVVEDARVKVLDAHEHREHDSAEQDAQPGGGVGGAARTHGVAGAEEVAYACARCNADAKWDRVHDLVRRHDDALRRQRDRAEASCDERDYLKGPPFSANVHDAQRG